ncbi:hypothetical protein AA0119_g9977 [Alternaria tenuissima]|uniref:Uncharacterized protein n=1 Tax=Alternaria tenuissima TaxID=119927 RepID=A0ABY0G0H1_9PLEO|nr:hypothetical protein AA0119_g9977 [Alternaria tenuissima]RYO09070.1 hypothetical protein AA0121_g11121 [Alternaria tenuissima]
MMSSSAICKVQLPPDQTLCHADPVTELVTSTFRPSVHPVVLMGSYESRSRGEIVQNFRASVVGWDVLDASEMFFVSPQEGTDRKSALMAVIRLVEQEAHKRMAELEAKIAHPL